MSIAFQRGEDGEIEAAWEVPFERFAVIIYTFAIGPALVASAVNLIMKDHLADDRRQGLIAVLMLPLFLVLPLLGWRISGLFWPNRPLSREEIEDWRRHHLPDEWRTSDD